MKKRGSNVFGIKIKAAFPVILEHALGKPPGTSLSLMIVYIYK